MKNLLLLMALAMAGCASGSGGADSAAAGSTASQGVDIWRNGPPSRPYHVIATVQQQGADGGASYGDEEALLADEARSRGADAVIVNSEVMVAGRIDMVSGRAIMVPKVNAELIQYQ